jgi:hypothetical protein
MQPYGTPGAGESFATGSYPPLDKPFVKAEVTCLIKDMMKLCRGLEGRAYEMFQARPPLF